MKSDSKASAKKFASDVSWMGFSGIITALTPLITLPALTKFYGTETYGVWQQITVTIAVLDPIICLRLETAFVRFFAGIKEKQELAQAFGAMLWTVLSSTAFVLFISFLFRYYLSILLFGDSKYITLIPIAFIWVSTTALFNFSLSYLHAKRKIKKISIIRLSFSIAKASIISGLAITGFQLRLIIISMIAIQIFFLIPVWVMIIREIGFPKPNFKGLQRYLAYSIPLISNVALLWVVNSSNRYFIVHFLGLSAAGIYSASYNLGNVISMFLYPISYVLFPTVSKYWEEGDLRNVKRYFEYTTKLFLFLAIPAATGMFVVSQPLLHILATDEFLSGPGLILLIAISGILLGIFRINIFVIHLIQKTKWIPFIIMLGAIANILLNIVLIPLAGILGAAISTILSYLILSTITLFWGIRELGHEVDFKFISKVVIGTLLMTFCLKFIEVKDLAGILIVSISGLVIFILSQLILKTLSDKEKRFIKNAIF